MAVLLVKDLLFLLLVLVAFMDLQYCVVARLAISSSALQFCRRSVSSRQYSNITNEEYNTMAGCLFQTTLEEHYSRIRMSQLWVGNNIDMNVSLLLSSSASSFNDEETVGADDICNINEHGMSDKYMCAISMEHMAQIAASKLCATHDQLEALRPSSNFVGEVDEEMMMMMRVSHIQSKGKVNDDDDDDDDDDMVRSIVCHHVRAIAPPDNALFLCGCINNAEYIEATLTNGYHSATSIVECPSSSSHSDDDHDDDVSCRLLIGDSVIVWLLKDGASSSCIQQKPAAATSATAAAATHELISNKKGKHMPMGSKNHKD